MDGKTQELLKGVRSPSSREGGGQRLLRAQKLRMVQGPQVRTPGLEQDLAGGPVVKTLPANARDAGSMAVPARSHVPKALRHSGQWAGQLPPQRGRMALSQRQDPPQRAEADRAGTQAGPPTGRPRTGRTRCKRSIRSRGLAGAARETEGEPSGVTVRFYVTITVWVEHKHS